MRGHVISCSGLKRVCRHDKVLSKTHAPSPAAVASAAEGNAFGQLVESWVNGAPPVLPPVMEEYHHWYANMVASWRVPPGCQSEVPLGLADDGEYMAVEELKPHVYTPVSDSDERALLTAGRADLVWCYQATGYPAGGINGVAYVGDLKRSAWRYGEPIRHPQLMALGLSYASRERCRYLRLGLYDARDATWDWSDVIDLQEDGPAMLEEIRTMATMDDEPHPHEGCHQCFERKHCEAGQRYLRAA